MAARRSAAAALAPEPVRQQTMAPNLGLYLDRPSILMPERAMSYCENFRIRDGEVSNEDLGYERFAPNNTFPHPVIHLDNFRQRSGTSYLLACTIADVAYYDSANTDWVFLNEMYSTGTVQTGGTGPNGGLLITGTGTLWQTEGIKAGDWYCATATPPERRVGKWIDGDIIQDPEPDPGGGFPAWYRILDVASETSLEIKGYTGSAYGPGVSYTVRKTLTAVEGDLWSSESFPKAQPANEDTWYATNGTEMVKWNGTANEYTLLSLGFTARKLKRYKNMMHWGDITISGERRNGSFRNSDVAQPEVFVGGTSSELAVIGGTDDLVGFEILGDHLVCFGERSVNMVEFVGDPIGYTIRTVLDDIGPFAPRLIVNQGDYIEFVSHDRAYRFDGVGKSEFGSQVFRDVLRSSDGARAWQSIGYRDNEYGEVHWLIALTTDVSGYSEFSYVEHYLEPVGSRDPTPHTRRALPALSFARWIKTGVTTFNQLTESFQDTSIRWDDRSLADDAPITVFGSRDGRTYQLNTGATFDGGGFRSECIFARRAAQDGRFKGLIRTVEPFVRLNESNPNKGFQITVNCYADPLDETAEASEANTYLLGKTGAQRIPFRVSARYYELDFLLDNPASTSAFPPRLMRLSGFEVENVAQGRRGRTA